jgi:hypothetical protein
MRGKLSHLNPVNNHIAICRMSELDFLKRFDTLRRKKIYSIRMMILIW